MDEPRTSGRPPAPRNRTPAVNPRRRMDTAFKKQTGLSSRQFKRVRKAANRQRKAEDRAAAPALPTPAEQHAQYAAQKAAHDMAVAEWRRAGRVGPPPPLPVPPHTPGGR